MWINFGIIHPAIVLKIIKDFPYLFYNKKEANITERFPMAKKNAGIYCRVFQVYSSIDLSNLKKKNPKSNDTTAQVPIVYLLWITHVFFWKFITRGRTEQWKWKTKHVKSIDVLASSQNIFIFYSHIRPHLYLFTTELIGQNKNGANVNASWIYAQEVLFFAYRSTFTLIFLFFCVQ